MECDTPVVVAFSGIMDAHNVERGIVGGVLDEDRFDVERPARNFNVTFVVTARIRRRELAAWRFRFPVMDLDLFGLVLMCLAVSEIQLGLHRLPETARVISNGKLQLRLVAEIK